MFLSIHSVIKPSVICARLGLSAKYSSERARESDQNHDRFLIAPARDQALVLDLLKLAGAEQAVLGKTAVQGKPINRLPRDFY